MSSKVLSVSTQMLALANGHSEQVTHHRHHPIDSLKAGVSTNSSSVSVPLDLQSGPKMIEPVASLMTVSIIPHQSQDESESAMCFCRGAVAVRTMETWSHVKKAVANWPFAWIVECHSKDVSL